MRTTAFYILFRCSVRVNWLLSRCVHEIWLIYAHASPMNSTFRWLLLLRKCCCSSFRNDVEKYSRCVCVCLAADALRRKWAKTNGDTETKIQTMTQNGKFVDALQWHTEVFPPNVLNLISTLHTREIFSYQINIDVKLNECRVAGMEQRYR